MSSSQGARGIVGLEIVAGTVLDVGLLVREAMWCRLRLSNQHGFGVRGRCSHGTDDMSQSSFVDCWKTEYEIDILGVWENCGEKGGN